jgi:hypothetical protein
MRFLRSFYAVPTLVVVLNTPIFPEENRAAMMNEEARKKNSSTNGSVQR